MIDTIKRWIEKIKSSPILKPFIKTKCYQNTRCLEKTGL